MNRISHAKNTDWQKRTCKNGWTMVHGATSLKIHKCWVMGGWMVTFVCQQETFGTVFSPTLKSVLDFDFDQNFDDCTTWLFFEDYIMVDVGCPADLARHSCTLGCMLLVLSRPLSIENSLYLIDTSDGRNVLLLLNDDFLCIQPSPNYAVGFSKGRM